MKLILVLISLVGLQLFGANSISTTEKIAIIKVQRFIDLGHYKKALYLASKTLKEYPKNDQLLTLTGQIYKETDKLETALEYLKKALLINPDNKVARALIQEINETIEASKNETISDALEWLSDKGIDFLMIFFGVIGGELLIRNLNNCKANEEKRYIINYVSDHITIPSKFKHRKILFRLQCIGIYFLISFTGLSVIIIVILMAEILLNAPYLRFISDKGFWQHIFLLYLCMFTFMSIVKTIIYFKKRKREIPESHIADILTDYLDERNTRFLREEFQILSLLGEKEPAKIHSIFNNVLIDEDRKLLKEIYEQKILKEKM